MPTSMFCLWRVYSILRQYLQQPCDTHVTPMWYPCDTHDTVMCYRNASKEGSVLKIVLKIKRTSMQYVVCWAMNTYQIDGWTSEFHQFGNGQQSYSKAMQEGVGQPACVVIFFFNYPAKYEHIVNDIMYINSGLIDSTM